MVRRQFDTAKGPATLRLIEPSDLGGLIQLNKQCFPDLAEQNVVWNRAQLQNHLRLFPEGQVLIEIDGRPVGAIASLIVHMGADPYRAHTYAGITDGGYFHNHDPQATRCTGPTSTYTPTIAGYVWVTSCTKPGVTCAHA